MKPKAVIISDIHYSLQTLELADAALKQAVAKANELGVPLIIAGDLHDTKANLRAECVNAIRATLSDMCREEPEHHDNEISHARTYILVGNHDKINEKSEEHALNFLKDLAVIVEKPQFTNDVYLLGDSLYLIPYHHDLIKLRAYLKKIPSEAYIVMHQGILGSEAGHYIQDPTALRLGDVYRHTVISGHYHRRQTIKTGKGKTFSYVGNPYTLNFGEANNPEKGYQILNDDGTLTFVPTNLRKHVVIEGQYFRGELVLQDKVVTPQDLVWIKITGHKAWLHTITRKEVEEYIGFTNFRLDFIANDETIELGDRSNQTQSEILDGLIDALPDEVSKESLKALWRSFNETNQGTGN